MATYSIVNANGLQGRAWATTYATREEAAEAIRAGMGWDEAVLSPSFTVTSPTWSDAAPSWVNGWCAYETQDECDADEEGAHAPRIVEARS